MALAIPIARPRILIAEKILFRLQVTICDYEEVFDHIFMLKA